MVHALRMNQIHGALQQRFPGMIHGVLLRLTPASSFRILEDFAVGLASIRTALVFLLLWGAFLEGLQYAHLSVPMNFLASFFALRSASTVTIAEWGT